MCQVCLAIANQAYTTSRDNTNFFGVFSWLFLWVTPYGSFGQVLSAALRPKTLCRH